ncbi:hypothetical protein STRIP9103_00749 [Streptomyces ipomoeae 91-03]|uniref:Uncharacterized protein n=1 Tax=Streptomyces ipomoeae 91-03 TaxID=698759 RepID=L1KRU7_9ACTN|nr:hypothetical protein STRIP9103_00749 [Streptomyces ipomoeae 91-03]
MPPSRTHRLTVAVLASVASESAHDHVVRAPPEFSVAAVDPCSPAFGARPHLHAHPLTRREAM